MSRLERNQVGCVVLARLFIDYEPGIHSPQSQIQSGEADINIVRIYSPVKQGHDQDSTGEFTHHWVPELAHLEGKALQKPWKEQPIYGSVSPKTDRAIRKRDGAAAWLNHWANVETAQIDVPDGTPDVIL